MYLRLIGRVCASSFRRPAGYATEIRRPVLLVRPLVRNWSVTGQICAHLSEREPLYRAGSDPS
jgi:hypothetical protein